MGYSYYNDLLLKNLRKHKPIVKEEKSGIVYGIAPCKGGYGVYVTSLSTEVIKVIGYRIRGLKNLHFRVYGMPENWTVLKTLPVLYVGSLSVISGRIARKPDKASAEHYVERLNKASIEYQLAIASKLNYTPYIADKGKHYRAVKLQYYQFYRNIRGKFVKLGTSQDYGKLEELGLSYDRSNVAVTLKPTVSRTVIMDASQQHNGVEIPYIAKGIRGMTANIKDQGPQFLRRISQKRKRTTGLNFWKNR